MTMTTDPTPEPPNQPPEPAPMRVRQLAPIGATARKNPRLPGVARTKSQLQRELERATRLKQEAAAKADDPPPPTTNARARVPIDTDAWSTRRHGDPRLEVEGWQVDDQPDYIALRAILMRGPNQLSWRLNTQSPVTQRAIRYHAVDHQGSPVRLGEMAPARARRHLAAERRKASFLAHLAAGHTVQSSCALVAVNYSTYATWRKRDPDFLAKVEAIRARDPDAPVSWDGSFASARRYFFGYDSYTHHLAIIDAIEKTPSGGVTMILLPPEAGKTTLLEDYCTLKIAEDPNYRILYVSETAEGHARKVLSTLKDRFTDPDIHDPNAPDAHVGEFIARFGPFHDPAVDSDRPWNQNYIKVHKSSGRRDYSLQTAGWKSRIYGARCDLLVFDDVQSDQSLTQTEVMLRTMRRTFFNRPGKDGRIIFIGTRIGNGDVYEALIEDGIVNELVQIPAMDEHGNSYCPEMWPPADLEQKRHLVGEEAWWGAYMQQPQLAQDATFTDELITQCQDVDLYACRRPDINVTRPGGNFKVIAGLDPALGGGNALCIAAVNHTRFDLIDMLIDYKLMRNEDIFTKVKEACKYGFKELIVEKNSQQRGLARDDRLRDIASRFGFQIREHETTGQNKWDFNWGVGAMAGSFVRREIHLPWADEFSQKRLASLIGELRAWRPGLTPKLQRQDQVMAMWFAWLWWQREKHELDVDLDAWKTSGVPWRPGDMSGRWSRQQVSA